MVWGNHSIGLVGRKADVWRGEVRKVQVRKGKVR